MKQLKVAIIGSGSTYTPELIEGLIKRAESLPLKELSLMDIDKPKLDIVGALAKRMIDHAGIDCKFVLTENLDETLDGADIVFVQIRVGKLPARIKDEKIPLKYRLIGQETTGIGGFFKALRTVPVILDIGQRMERLCPDAWMINFSNPSGICAQAMHKYGKTKMMGLCNVPIAMLSESQKALGIEGAEVDYMGMNHLSFVTSIRLNGRDYLEEAVNGCDELLDKLNGIQGFDKETIRLVKAIPNGYLKYFYHTGKMLDELLSKEKSRGEQCIEIENELLALFQDTSLYVKPEQLSQRGGAMYSEAAVSLAESIWLDRGDVHVVNTLNNGAIPFMGDDDVVETSSVITRNGASSIPISKVDNPHIQNIMRTVKTYERYTVEAAVNGSRNDAILALMSNPLITDMDVAKNCFDEMLEAHREFLPRF